jgi:hypothetical protein
MPAPSLDKADSDRKYGSKIPADRKDGSEECCYYQRTLLSQGFPEMRIIDLR